MKKLNYAAVILCLMLFAVPAWADEALEREAAQKAAESHAKGNEDMIYAQQDTKALYYQNQQIIELLKDIKKILKEDRDRTKNQ